MFSKMWTYVRAHKVVSAIIVIALAGGGYYWYGTSGTAPAVTKYVVENATASTVVSSVSGTGQVQAGTTIQVSAKVSETVTRIPVTVGQHVAAGQLLVQLDPTNERRALASAELSLQQAQLSLEQTQQIATTTLLQDRNAVTTGIQAVQNASTSLANDYQTGFADLGSTFVSLQTVMTGLQNFAKGNDVSPTQKDPDAYVSLMPVYLQPGTQPYEDTFIAQYQTALAAYQQNLLDYHAASSSESTAQLDALFAETYNTAKAISATVKAGKDFLNYVVTNYPTGANGSQALPSVTNTLQTNFSNYTTSMGTVLSGVQGTVTSIASGKNSVVNTQNSLEQASETLAELVAGPSQTTVLGQQISVQSAENNVTTAQENLGYTSVTAPIAGTVSAISAVVGETAGSNAVTIVGEGQVAQVTLNEGDAAKVKLGDRATLTFDALPDLSLAGTVVEIDPVGTVSQGVVSYNVQVGFSQPANTTSSAQVKPGMSVTADIVTDVAQNVIAVPNAAVTTVNGSSYILAPATPVAAAALASSSAGGITLPATKMLPVTTGISNDTMTAIVSGVNVGDQIIVQTVKSSSASKSTSATTGSSSGNALRLLTGGGGGGSRPPGN